jgi:hypothetical protein
MRFLGTVPETDVLAQAQYSTTIKQEPLPAPLNHFFFSRKIDNFLRASCMFFVALLGSTHHERLASVQVLQEG